MFQNIAKSTEQGLSKDAAIRALTLTAAEILGVESRTGSIEVGKIANLTVVKGDLFGQKTITHVFVDGTVFEPKAPTTPSVGRAARSDGASGTPAGTQPSAANVVGTYTVLIQPPGQSLPGTLTIVQQGSVLSGTLTTELGDSPFSDGRVNGNEISFSGNVTVGGQVIAFSVKATLTGNQLSGTVDTTQGAAPLSGTKNP